MLRAGVLVSAFACFVGCGSSTKEPAPAERLREADTPPAVVHPAVGSLAELSPELGASFVDSPSFAPLRTPGPDDWLSSHTESGQTVAQFIADGPNRPSAERDKIYVLPIGPLSAVAPSIDTMAAYTHAFYGLEVEVLDQVSVESLGASGRDWDLGPQLLTDDVLNALEQRLPEDAFLLVGLTMTDLYPGEDWNYVFGYASLERHVCVYSLLRFDPQLDDPRTKLGPEARRALMLRRALQLMTHELTHSFGMRHCVHYDCLMNGVNHLAEADLHPLHLCPVCLRKLHVALGFDPVARYEDMRGFYREHGMAEDSAWIGRRVQELRAAAP